MAVGCVGHPGSPLDQRRGRGLPLVTARSTPRSGSASASTATASSPTERRGTAPRCAVSTTAGSTNPPGASAASPRRAVSDRSIGRGSGSTSSDWSPAGTCCSSTSPRTAPTWPSSWATPTTSSPRSSPARGARTGRSSSTSAATGRSSGDHPGELSPGVGAQGGHAFEPGALARSAPSGISHQSPSITRNRGRRVGRGWR